MDYVRNLRTALNQTFEPMNITFSDHGKFEKTLLDFTWYWGILHFRAGDIAVAMGKSEQAVLKKLQRRLGFKSSPVADFKWDYFFWVGFAWGFAGCGGGVASCRAIYIVYGNFLSYLE